MCHFGGHYWGMHWVWWMAWGIIITLIFYAIWIGKNSRKKGKEDDPIDILKKRYASGEISSEEYEERKKKLEG